MHFTACRMSCLGQTDERVSRYVQQRLTAEAYATFDEPGVGTRKRIGGTCRWADTIADARRFATRAFSLSLS